MAQSVWTKAPLEIIKDLIAAANTDFGPVRASFDLGAPSTNTGTKNTKVTVTPNDTAYSGTVDVTYNRLTLTTYITAKVPSGSVQWGDTEGQTKLTASSSQADILAVVNAALGLDVTTGEFSTLTVTEVTANTDYTINMTAASTSLLFTGSATLTVTQTAPTTPTSSIITTTELDGLDAPTA